MRVGILGSGSVAKALAAGFLKRGHEVMLGTRTPAKLADWAKSNPTARISDVPATAAFADVIVLAVRGSVALDVLRSAGESHLNGKTVIDTTNPIADSPPDHGVLRYFTTLDDSLMERLQRAFPAVQFVKAFNSVGNALMVDPVVEAGRPSMFICGNSEAAKTTVSGILDQFGWQSEDMGGVEAARAIEPLCMLWCIPSFLGKGRHHAFKLVR